MKAVVVYESLWGNTAEVARAVAEGLGEGARALSAAQATQAEIDAADLVVAGAPVHMARLPTEKTREKARLRYEDPDTYPGLPQPDTSGPTMGDWLGGLPKHRDAFGAAFDTRSSGKWAGNAARSIASLLRRRGYRLLGKPTGFVVQSQSGPLAEGERERAVEWGRELSRLLGKD